jgi:hypothetical protein
VVLGSAVNSATLPFTANISLRPSRPSCLATSAHTKVTTQQMQSTREAKIVDAGTTIHTGQSHELCGVGRFGQLFEFGRFFARHNRHCFKVVNPALFDTVVLAAANNDILHITGAPQKTLVEVSGGRVHKGGERTR